MGESTHDLGVIADPGMPIRVARRLLRDFIDELSTATGQQWNVELSQRRLPLDSEGDIPLAEHAARLREENSWEYLVYLTDLPLVHADEVMLCEVSAVDRAALISVPSLGVWRTSARLRRLITALVDAARGVSDYPSEPSLKRVVGRRRVRRDLPAALEDDSPEAEPDHDDTWTFVQLPGLRNRLELLAGMVRSNQPTGLLPALSTAFTLATATGAFGIFYGSIWTLADALHPLRLLLISAVVIGMFSTWLIVGNGLWSQGRETSAGWQRRFDNAATILTIGSGVAMLHLALFALLFVLSLIIIDAGHLQFELMHPVSLADYVALAWLSTSLGTFAGALGSNFNSEDAVREATYSRRVYERRQLADSFESRGATE